MYGSGSEFVGTGGYGAGYGEQVSSGDDGGANATNQFACASICDDGSFPCDLTAETCLTPAPTATVTSTPEQCVDCSRRQVRQLLFGHLILNCCSDDPNSIEFDD